MQTWHKKLDDDMKLVVCGCGAPLILLQILSVLLWGFPTTYPKKGYLSCDLLLSLCFLDAAARKSSEKERERSVLFIGC